jgi:hypothetical protein
MRGNLWYEGPVACEAAVAWEPIPLVAMNDE